MKVKWYGHAAFLITTDQGIKIITHPYEPGAFGGGIAYGPIPDQADIVLVSHDHADHNYVKGLRENRPNMCPRREEFIQRIMDNHDLSFCYWIQRDPYGYNRMQYSILVKEKQTQLWGISKTTLMLNTSLISLIPGWRGADT